MSPREPRIFNRKFPGVPADAVYIGRPSKWGNPFGHKASAVAGTTQVETREDAIAQYAAWLEAHPEVRAAAQRELRGRDLVCWCAPLPCHGDILLQVANEDIAMKWPRPICVIDTETTGFHAEAEVVELAAIVIHEDGQAFGWSSLVKPEGPIGARERQALDVNKIEEASLVWNPERAAVIAAFRQFLNAHKPVQVTSYNVPFDRARMKYMLRDHADLDLPWGPCIMQRAGKAMHSVGVQWKPRSHTKNPSLAEARAWAKVEHAGPAHRAFSDAYTAALVLLAIERGGAS